MLIFPRKNIREHFTKGGPPGCIGGANSSGWVNEDLFLAYLNHFICHKLHGLTAKNILSAFQSTGIFPYNRDLFDETDFSPATVTDRDLPEELERNDPIPAEQLPAPQPEPSSTATPVPQPETDSTATPARQPEPSSTVTPAQQPEPSSIAAPAR